jgi:tetratricopeptide (TPR) repeat protein
MDDATQRGREGVRAAQEAKHTTATMWSLPHLGLALAGQGRYEEAQQVFDEARRFGREYGVETLLARAISMSAGFHLDVWDLEGHEALAHEARELARSLGFAPPAVSAGIDLLLNFARQRAVGRAEPLIEEVAASVAKASGWHGWLWSLRLAQARAELALARGDLREVVRWAGEAIDQSRARRRVKYEVLGLTTRGAALVRLGRTKEAITELRRAVAAARGVADPALNLRPLAQLLLLDEDDVLAEELAKTGERIRAALPEPEMRGRFEARFILTGHGQ